MARTIAAGLGLLLLLVSGVAGAQPLELRVAGPASELVRSVVIERQLDLRGAQAGDRLTVRAVIGDEVVAEAAQQLAGPGGFLAEAGLILVDAPDLGCQAGATAFILVHGEDTTEATSRNARACLALDPATAREDRLAALEGGPAAALPLPRGQWLPFLALELNAGVGRAANYRDAHLLFYAIVTPDDALPPLPSPTSSIDLARIVSEALRSSN